MQRFLLWMIRLVQTDGYEILEATNGRIKLEMAERHTPNLISDRSLNAGSAWI